MKKTILILCLFTAILAATACSKGLDQYFETEVGYASAGGETISVYGATISQDFDWENKSESERTELVSAILDYCEKEYNGLTSDVVGNYWGEDHRLKDAFEYNHEDGSIKYIN